LLEGAPLEVGGAPLFDQRGCGRSLPHASGPEADLASNTTHHLIEDVDLLRRPLSIERWQVLGGSWGATPALEYGQRHPQQSPMVLVSVVTTTRREIEWVTRHAGRFLPQRNGRGFAMAYRVPSAMAPSSRPTTGCSSIRTPRWTSRGTRLVRLGGHHVGTPPGDPRGELEPLLVVEQQPRVDRRVAGLRQRELRPDFLVAVHVDFNRHLLVEELLLLDAEIEADQR
jgi:pimeloyl-ACP methyl ester carboxylesterase